MTMIEEMRSFEALGIDFEEKAFYDILKALTRKYEFEYPEDKLLHLALEVEKVVDDKSKYTDWSRREDIKADLVILLAENAPPLTATRSIMRFSRRRWGLSGGGRGICKATL